MLKAKIALGLFIVCFLHVSSQHYQFKISFTSKDTAQFLLTPTENFLSDRAITRKNKLSIPIDISDFPITGLFIDSLSKNFTIRSTSKWYNNVIISTNDSSKISLLSGVSFVKDVVFIGKSTISLSRKSEQTKKLETSDLDYNHSKLAIEQLNGQELHNRDFLGQGMIIAVIDAGFVNTNTLSIFNDLRNENRILGTKNFVTRSANVYSSDNHGTQVLSVLAANKSGELIGTAPQANYLLLISEDVRVEEPLEEFLFIEALEYADSAGADLVNASIGYNSFDQDQFSHQISELESQDVLITKASNLAVTKGMLLLVSAGNEGNDTWQHLLFPANAEKVITVGSVDLLGNKTNFSSLGIAGSTNLKPDVMALGSNVMTSSSEGVYNGSSGTSFSCPIICGLTACLWQAFTNASTDSIKNLLISSSSMFNNPNNSIGNGIPNFKLILDKELDTSFKLSEGSVIFPNPIINNSFYLNCSFCSDNISLFLFNELGKLVFQDELNTFTETLQKINLPPLSSGTYHLQIISSGSILSSSLIILKN